MDYAAAVLGPQNKPQQPAQQPQSYDYAADVLGPKARVGLQGSVMAPVQPGGGASFGALTQSYMVDNPETRIRIFAKNRFPNLKEEDAMSRYGVVNGDIVYLDTDGQIRKEAPGGFWNGVREVGASVLGNLPSAVLGTVGAIAGAPGGPPGVAAGGMVGGAGGKAIQQVIGNLVFNEPQTVEGNMRGQATEGAANAVFSWMGSKLGEFLGTRNVARDISRLDRPAAEALQQKGQNIGVDLNVAQTTNLPSLKGRYEVLGRLEPSMDVIGDAAQRQGQQAVNAANRFVQGISGASPQQAGTGARTGANAILDRIAEDKATASRPWYQKALQVAIDPTDENLQRLADTPAFKSAWERAKRIAANEGTDLGDSANNMRALHYVKLGLDDLIERGGTEGVGATEKRAIIGVKDRLLKFMDVASNDYARARSIYGHYMPTLKASREGMIGELADLANTDLNTAARRVFNANNSPEDIARLRSMFYRYDQGEQWKKLLGSYLGETLTKAGREFQTTGGVATQAPAWRAILAGDKRQLANLRAGMTADQFQGFQDMMDVFEAMGRVRGFGGSPTMPLQEAAGQLRREAEGAIPKLLAPRNTVINWLTEARMGKHAERMAEVMTSPDGLRRLKQLKQMSPNDQRFIAGFSSLFGIGDETEQKPADRPIKQ